MIYRRFLRIEQKQHVRPEAAVDLSQVAVPCRGHPGPDGARNGVEIKLSSDSPVVVTGDRDELVRVAENLIENAIKYGARPDAPGGDRVEVSVARTAKDGALAVRDFGHGIAPEHLPRLTERFYRVDAGQSRAKNGTGLGLALVKHILARHRGRLTITSRPDQGSTFTATGKARATNVRKRQLRSTRRNPRSAPGNAVADVSCAATARRNSTEVTACNVT